MVVDSTFNLTKKAAPTGDTPLSTTTVTGGFYIRFHTMKTCFKCQQSKSINQFYTHPEMGDGHLGKCKECAKKDALIHRQCNIDRIRAYDRARGKLLHRKRNNVTQTRKFRQENPLASKAHMALARAIRNRKIKKPKKCHECRKKVKVYGHHKDYNFPLEVIWLCQVCHKAEHKRIKSRTSKL